MVIKITPSVARTCLAYNFHNVGQEKMSLVANARDILNLIMLRKGLFLITWDVIENAS